MYPSIRLQLNWCLKNNSLKIIRRKQKQQTRKSWTKTKLLHLWQSSKSITEKRLSKTTDDSFTTPYKSTSCVDTPTDTYVIVKGQYQRIYVYGKWQITESEQEEIKARTGVKDREKKGDAASRWFGHARFLSCSRYKNCSDIYTFEVIEVDTIVNIFCTPILNFVAENVLQNKQQFGISVLHSNKLNTYLTKLMSSLWWLACFILVVLRQL